MRRTYILVLILGLTVAGFTTGLLLATPQNGNQSGNLVAAVDSKAPDFSLQNYDGKKIGLHDYAGKIVVLEWVNPECPYVQRHYKAKTMQTLANKYKPDGVVWLSINTTYDATNDFNKQWADEQNVNYPVLNDSAGTVGHLYHATNTPEMYIVGKDGILLYKGAIDNDPEGDLPKAKVVNYVQKAMGEILDGKPVSEKETKPYGCSMKYKN